MAEAAIQSVHGESPLGFKRTTLNVRTGEQRQYELTRAGNCPGIHGCLTEIPIDSSVQGSEPLANLIAFAEHEIGTGAQIELDEPFVVEAYCMSCGDVMKVEAPEWAYDMKPRCLNCSGPWTPIQVARGGGTPVKPIRIDATTDEGVLSMKCAKAGLVSLNLVQVLRADGSSSRVARMAGKLTDLFEEV